MAFAKSKVAVVAVVVTYNRKHLLSFCLHALLNQTMPLDKIILIDNASSDGTYDLLVHSGYLSASQIEYIRLPENRGGAGGFYEGVRRAYAGGYNWVWLMDDDAYPAPDALERLALVATDDTTAYVGVAVDRNDEITLCWPIVVYYSNVGRKVCRYVHELPHGELWAVRTAPFVGLLLSREIIRQVGFPRADFFIRADDFEYSLRIRRHGATVKCCTDSKIYHPRGKVVKVCWLEISDPHPVMHYYSVRNILYAKRLYYPKKRFWLLSVPEAIFKSGLYAIAGCSGSLAARVKWSYKGVVDGIRGRLGRHGEP